MNIYRNLYKRVLRLESLEARDAIFKFLGKDYYKKWCLIEYKIKDPMYKSYHMMVELGIDDVKDYIDSFFQNRRSWDKRFAFNDAKLVYDDNAWKV